MSNKLNKLVDKLDLQSAIEGAWGSFGELHSFSCFVNLDIVSFPYLFTETRRNQLNNSLRQLNRLVGLSQGMINAGKFSFVVAANFSLFSLILGRNVNARWNSIAVLLGRR